jgi:hypothetical protein
VDFIIYMAPGAIMAAIPASGLILWLYRSTLMRECQHCSPAPLHRSTLMRE